CGSGPAVPPTSPSVAQDPQDDRFGSLVKIVKLSRKGNRKRFCFQHAKVTPPALSGSLTRCVAGYHAAGAEAERGGAVGELPDSLRGGRDGAARVRVGLLSLPYPTPQYLAWSHLHFPQGESRMHRCRRFLVALCAGLLTAAAARAQAPERTHDITVDDYF